MYAGYGTRRSGIVTWVRGFECGGDHWGEIEGQGVQFDFSLRWVAFSQGDGWFVNGRPMEWEWKEVER